MKLSMLLFVGFLVLISSAIEITADSIWCTGCEKVVTTIVSDGCGLACDVLPAPLDDICSVIVSTGICQLILKWIGLGKTNTAICETIGFCSACDCGICTNFTYHRCLSVPNDCKNQSEQQNLKRMEKEFFLPFIRSENNFTLTYQKLPEPEFCVDGSCDDNHVGCCLTCY